MYTVTTVHLVYRSYTGEKRREEDD